MKEYTDEQKELVMAVKSEVDRLAHELIGVLSEFKSETVSNNDLILVRQRALSALTQHYTLLVCRAYDKEIQKFKEELERTKE